MEKLVEKIKGKNDRKIGGIICGNSIKIRGKFGGKNRGKIGEKSVENR